MEINIITRHSIGDTVYILEMFTKKTSASEPVFYYEISEKRISDVKCVIGKSTTYISYLLEGMTSYEGENWFSDKNESACSRFIEDYIYDTREAAQAAIDQDDYLTKHNEKL